MTSFTESQILSISNDTIYLTGGSYVKLPAGFSGDYNDLTNKPAIPTVPTNISAFTNDVGYITSADIPAGFSGDYNDLTNKPTIPTNVSSFTNDAGYITNAAVPINVSQLTNDAGYLTSFTESQVLTISNDTIYLTGGSYVKLPAGFSGDYNDLTNKPTIPTVPTNVSEFINDAGYITTADVPTNVSQLTNDAGYLTSFTESQVLTISNDTIYLTGGSYVKLPAGVVVPTDVSAFTNDAGYITNAEVPTNVSQLTNDVGYLTSFTESQVLTISNDTIYLTGGSFVKLPSGFSGDYNDLTNTPTIPIVPTDVSAFTNDTGYITSADIPAGFSGDYNDLTNKPTIPTVPANVSSFMNDAGYITNTAIPTNVSQLVNDANYITIADVPSVIVPTNVSAFTNDAGYITSYTETQNLASVIANGNSAGNSQIKNVNDPIEAKDAVNKRYIDSLFVIYYSSLDSMQNVLDSLSTILDGIGNVATILSDSCNITEQGAINSVFSVSVNKKIRFSRGNLQYQASNNLWKFAEYQYRTQDTVNRYANSTYNEWIDIFGWGTSGFNNIMPYQTSTNTNHYPTILSIAGTNYDWGVYCSIINGGDDPGLWRTITRSEWEYLLTMRQNATQLVALATVNNKKGLLILPDGWSVPDGIIFTPRNTLYTTNVYFGSDWLKLQASGAVFLPSEGYSGILTDTPYYWTSTALPLSEQSYPSYSWRAYNIQEYVLHTTGINGSGTSYNNDRLPVRLIQDINTTYSDTYHTECGNHYVWGDVDYTESGVYCKIIPNGNYLGGDSIARVHLTILGATTPHEYTIVTSSTPYIWHDVTYSNSGIYTTSVFDNVNGCYEGDTLVLTINVDGANPGVFTIDASGRTIQFSKGNLQYRASDNTWRFAEHQYYAIGTGNSTISSTNSNYIDLFGWGTSGWNSGATAYQPYSTSTTSSHYYVGGSSSNTLTGTYAMADWGVANSISNGGNQPNMWRTMTNDEWTYLLNTRENAAQKKGKAIITIGTSQYKGLILLPDSWTCPFGCTFTAGGNFSSNNYTEEQWAAMEASGAVFLPITGRRNNASISSAATDGYYWTTDIAGSSARCINIYNTTSISQTTASRYYGCSVRLVKDNE